MKKIVPALLGITLLVIFIYSLWVSKFNYQIEYEQLDEYNYHFVMIGKEKIRKNWKDIYEGASTYAKNNKIALEMLINESVNDSKEIDFFDMAVDARVDGIVVNGYDKEEMVKIAKKAQEYEIPVIFINDESKVSPRTAYIGVNNYLAGQMAVDLLKKYHKGQLNIGLVMEKKDTIQNDIRHESILLAINEDPNLRWASTVSSVDSKIQLYNDIKKMLVDNPKINAIIGTSALHGEVIGEVLVDLNLVGKVTVIGFGDYPLTIRYIQNGVIDATINVNGQEIGKNAMEVLLKEKKGDLVEDAYYMPLEVIDITKFSKMKVIRDE